MRVLIAGGGTAGHVNPAIATADALRAAVPGAEILFAGTREGLEADLVPRAGYRFATVTVGGFERRLSWRTLGTLGKAAAGGVQAWRLLRRIRPQVVIGTGGYVCGPVVFMAHWLRIPTLILEQNVIPGVTNRLLGRVADCIAVTYAASRQYFPARANVVVTGNPIRRELLTVDRKAARAAMGIAPGQKMVLSVGGSVGAQKLNDAMAEVLVAYGKQKEVVFWHVSGKDKYAAMLGKLREYGIDIQPPGNINVEPYLYNIGEAYAAADLIVCRAGGITLSEITALGLPAIIIPYPHATNNHQEYNARQLEQEGAAVVIRDKELSGPVLLQAIGELLGTPQRLQQMAARSKGLGRPDALNQIVGLALALAGKKGS